jgi:hypothetical protein
VNWLAQLFLSFFQAVATYQVDEAKKRQAELDASRKALREELEAAEARKKASQ